jgi:hypothetical protein
MSTTAQGNIGEFVIAADLIEKGCVVMFPSGGNPHYDLVVEKEGIFRRVQVKYVTEKDGVIIGRLYTMGRDRKMNLHTNKDFDILALYEPKSKEIYYISLALISNATQIVLRVGKTKNKMQKGIHFAKDYQVLRV